MSNASSLFILADYITFEVDDDNDIVFCTISSTEDDNEEILF